ncbi:Porphobilinogen deaminase (PBG) (Hydroxymethylbilane synthase) (HMBS) (Pre-uroporphyrinogen synthase) [Durusdinium trenchii]|uniref:hydroxymethylbilane synthase n=2 Tax=Symbiodiniaceae TaxID=252141 RepID=A0A9P1BDU8_9DINO|nr:unnamed protein product [Cladocopium goreaui]
MTTSKKIRIGTRASALARWQAEWVAAELKSRAGVEVELVPISTAGDRQQQGPIGSIGTQGVFTKEIQKALLDDRVDVAVHSLKDLPTDQVEGLMLGAVPPRESPGDALVCREKQTLDDLPVGAVVGTGSPRRRAQLLNLRPDLSVKDVRGNVDTRLRKLDDGEYDALVLAKAGLVRLELDDRISYVLASEQFLSAIGQGALGIEIREGDAETLEAVAHLNDSATFAAVAAERALLAHLRGGCLAPVAALAEPNDDGTLHLRAVVLSNDGSQRLDASQTAPTEDAVQLGREVAEALLAQGAAKLIAAARDAG